MSEIYISQSDYTAEFETKRFPNLPDFREPRPVSEVIKDCHDAGVHPGDVEFDEYCLKNYNDFMGEGSGWTAETWEQADAHLTLALDSGLTYDEIFEAADELGTTWDDVVDPGSYDYKKYESAETYAQLLHEKHEDLRIEFDPSDPLTYIYEVFDWFRAGYYAENSHHVITSHRELIA